MSRPPSGGQGRFHRRLAIIATPPQVEQSGVTTLRQLWQFRGYIQSGVARDFSLRYRGSVLGASLIFIVPAFQVALYALVFGNLMKGRLPDNPTIYGYSIYLCAGILFWNFFSGLLQRSQNLYIENANLLKKVAFPRAALSIVNFLAMSIDLGVALLMLFLFMLLTAPWPGGSLLWLLPIWLIVAGLALGFGLCIAVLQVFFRDFAALTGIGLQLLFWGTPIVYTPSILPESLVPWLLFNPLVAPVATVQALALGSALPPLHSWISTGIIGVGGILLSGHLYRRHEAELMDTL